MLTILCLVALCASAGQADFFSALAGMEVLLETEAVLMNTLQGYIADEEVKLHKLRRHLSEYARAHDESSQEGQSYLSNPISAYLLVKRLTTDWKQVVSYMEDTSGIDLVKNFTRHHPVLKFPSDDDLSGAAIAVTRLQDVYKMNASSVARGELNGVKYKKELKAHDCYELGRQAYNSRNHYHTVLWMTEALNRLKNEDVQIVSKVDILGYLAFSTFKEGNTKLALQLTDELLELVPDHSQALNNRFHYLKLLAGTQENKNVTVSEEDEKKAAALAENELYGMLCRGEIDVDPEIKSRLKCRYVHKGNPFLRLAPLKEEEYFLKPRIVLYHNVMFDSEIETVKKLAIPRFKRSTVQNFETGEVFNSTDRLGKTAFIDEKEHIHIKNINQRCADLSGLDTNTAEALQVVNYGIGGHFNIHCDFAYEGEMRAFKAGGLGNRIATALYYMSDVPQGGATVFPNLKVALKPIKGSAAFWFNLHKDGRGDYLTSHAACPVLSGSKWVSNKWFHEKGQDQLRPCGLTPDSPPKKMSPSS